MNKLNKLNLKNNPLSLTVGFSDSYQTIDQLPLGQYQSVTALSPGETFNFNLSGDDSIPAQLSLQTTTGGLYSLISTTDWQIVSQDSTSCTISCSYGSNVDIATINVKGSTGNFPTIIIVGTLPT
jgi:hypothetical protein